MSLNRNRRRGVASAPAGRAVRGEGGGHACAQKRRELLLTSHRIVFTNATPVSLGRSAFFHSFDFPLATMRGEKFNQPLFYCNNLTGAVDGDGDGGSSPVHFTLEFRDGGCGTFLHYFYRTLRQIRAPPTSTSTNKPLEESAAFVDPSDSSVVFIVTS